MGNSNHGGYGSDCMTGNSNSYFPSSFNNNYTSSYKYSEPSARYRTLCRGCGQWRQIYSGDICLTCKDSCITFDSTTKLREMEEAIKLAEEQAAIKLAEEQAAIKLAEEQAMQKANDKFNTTQCETAKKNNYINITNNCENRTRQLIMPSSFNNKWAAVDHELKLVYQHEKLENKRVYVWKYCKIYCNTKNHIIFHHKESDWPEPKDSTCNSFHEIEKVLNKNECPECKKEIDKVKAKLEQFETDQDEILGALNKPISAEKKIKLSEIIKLESDLNATFKECKEAIQSVENIVKEAKSIAEEEEGNVTYETQIDLNKFTEKAMAKQNDIFKQKQKVFLMEKQLNKKEMLCIKNAVDVDEQLNEEKDNKLQLNEQYENVDTLRQALSAMIQNKWSTNIVGDEMQKLNQLFDNLLKLLHEKYVANEKRMDELNKCKQRVQTIRTKLEKQKGENKYLLHVLDEEYNRLSTATECAIKKFEQNGIYFLSVTVGLKENIIDKFVEFGCDKLDDIMDMDDENLTEIGIQSKIIRKKILKQIQLLNTKFKENDKNDE